MVLKATLYTFTVQLACHKYIVCT